MENQNQFLTFRLGDETFAVPIHRVREVLEMTSVTHVPHLPAEFVGVINLRGNVVPVADLRRKFGLPEIGKTVDTAIIILEVGQRVLGVLVDAVSEVLEIAESEIEPPPRTDANARADFLAGIGKHEADFILILEVDAMFAFDREAEVAV